MISFIVALIWNTSRLIEMTATGIVLEVGRKGGEVERRLPSVLGGSSEVGTSTPSRVMSIVGGGCDVSVRGRAGLGDLGVGA